MNEVWKDIKGFEGYYQVSNTGHVRSLTREITKKDGSSYVRQGRFKKEMITPDGYLDVKLSRDGEDIRCKVHVLVAKHFIEDLDYKDGWEVDHLDADRQNNRVDNLEWVSRQENIKRAAAKGHMKRYGERNSNYGNHALKRRFQNEPELRKVQSRKGNQNGMCRSLLMTNARNHTLLRFDYIRECAAYLIDNRLVKSQSVTYTANTIAKCIKNETEYCGFTFSAETN